MKNLFLLATKPSISICFILVLIIIFAICFAIICANHKTYTKYKDTFFVANIVPRDPHYTVVRSRSAQTDYEVLYAYKHILDGPSTPYPIVSSSLLNYSYFNDKIYYHLKEGMVYYTFELIPLDEYNGPSENVMIVKSPITYCYKQGNKKIFYSEALHIYSAYSPNSKDKFHSIK